MKTLQTCFIRMFLLGLILSLPTAYSQTVHTGVWVQQSNGTAFDLTNSPLYETRTVSTNAVWFSGGNTGAPSSSSLAFFYGSQSAVNPGGVQPRVLAYGFWHTGTIIPFRLTSPATFWNSLNLVNPSASQSITLPPISTVTVGTATRPVSNVKIEIYKKLTTGWGSAIASEWKTKRPNYVTNANGQIQYAITPGLRLYYYIEGAEGWHFQSPTVDSVAGVTNPYTFSTYAGPSTLKVLKDSVVQNDLTVNVFNPSTHKKLNTGSCITGSGGQGIARIDVPNDTEASVFAVLYGHCYHSTPLNNSYTNPVNHIIDLPTSDSWVYVRKNNSYVYNQKVCLVDANFIAAYKYPDDNAKTDLSGKVTFTIPTGESFRFWITYNNCKYFSSIVTAPVESAIFNLYDVTMSPAISTSVSTGSHTFSWGAVPNASTYEFNIWDTAGTRTQNVPITGRSYVWSLNAPGTWHWAVRALDSNGRAIFVSPTTPFNVTEDTTQSNLVTISLTNRTLSENNFEENVDELTSMDVETLDDNTFIGTKIGQIVDDVDLPLNHQELFNEEINIPWNDSENELIPWNWLYPFYPTEY
jgi:hypothetical protein